MSADFWFQPNGGAFDPATIPGSLRFRDGARLENQNMSAAGNRRTWTISTWVKLGKDTEQRQCFYGIPGGGNNSRYFQLYFQNFQLKISGYSSTYYRSLESFRDYNGWYHIVVISDTPNATASERLRVYINGVRSTPDTSSQAITTVPQNFDWAVNNPNEPNYIGVETGSSNRFEGYLADFIKVDGAALEATNFGAFSDKGAWAAMEPVVPNYGTQGWRFQFADANQLGKDTSGRGNNFLSFNFNDEGSTGNLWDLMTDSPTHNFPTWNRLKPGYDLINNALNFVKTGNKNAYYFGTGSANFLLPEGVGGKYYWEYRFANGAGTIGIGNPFPPDEDADQILGISGGGNVYRNGTYVTNVGSITGTTVGFACDMATKSVSIYRNNSLLGTWSFTSPGPYILKAMHVSGSGSDDVWINNRNIYNPPSGYLPLSTENLEVNLPASISGTFVGNGQVDGPFIYTGCLPGRIKYGSIDVTYGNRLNQKFVDFCCNGFKIRRGDSASGTVSWTVDTTHVDGEYSGKKVPFGGKGYAPAPAATTNVWR